MRDDSAYSIRRHISIHAPRAGRDVIILRIRIEQSAFQSTRPVRGATPQTMAGMSPAIFQSTRPVRGATLLSVLVYLIIIFQSTRPVRGATGAVR